MNDAGPAALPPAVTARLATEAHAWICTLRQDGSPHVTPVWFVFQDHTWWVGSDARSVKTRNLRRDPRVSLTLEGGAAPVVAEGRATVHDGDFPAPIVAAFAGKYDGWDVTIPYGPGGRVMFEVPVDRWLLAGTAQ